MDTVFPLQAADKLFVIGVRKFIDVDNLYYLAAKPFFEEHSTNLGVLIDLHRV